MAIHNVNPKKLAFLLTQGTHDDELKKFFIDSRAQLILKGARVQNLPHGNEERIRTICERLPQKTDTIISAWFSKNISLSAPMPLSDVLTYLELYFNEKEMIPDEDVKLVARSALVYLSLEEPNEGLLSLLLRVPGAKEDQRQKVDIKTTDTEAIRDEIDTCSRVPIMDVSTPQNYHLAELLASFISGEEEAIDNALVAFPESTRALVGAFMHIREGEIDAAREQLEFIRDDSPESALVKKELSRLRHRRGADTCMRGMRVVIPQHLMDYPEADSYDIIGIFTNGSETGAVFVQPLCLVLDGTLYLLEHDDCIRLFPESGSVMTHRSALRRLPQYREIVRWKVEENKGAGGRTHFRLESELNPLSEIIRLTVPSTDPDEVRDQIKSWATSRRQSSGQQVMFLLSDGVTIAPPKNGDIMRDEGFDQPWHSWSSMNTWLIEGRQYCLDVPQSFASQLDLSPIDAAFKKLIKNIEVAKKSTINNAQKRELAELIRSHSTGEIELRAKRIVEYIDQIVLDEEILDSIVLMLGSRDDVRHRVDELVAKQVNERLIERSGLLTEIDSLKQSKDKFIKEGKEQEKRNRKLTESVVDSVKVAFSKAIDEGVATLATAEIFRTLSGTVRATAKGTSEALGSHSIEPYILEQGALTFSQAKLRLSAFGLNGRQAVILARLSKLAAQSGVGLILKGSAARQFIKVLARIDSETTRFIEIPIGLTSGGAVRRMLASLDRVSSLAILDADLSPFEAYGSPVLDLLFESAIEDQESRACILLSCSDSDISLPLPDIVRRVAITVDLASPWDQGQRTIEEIAEDSIPLLAPLRAKLFDGLNQLEGIERKHVEYVLAELLTH